jgi:hypothetical protein
MAAQFMVMNGRSLRRERACRAREVLFARPGFSTDEHGRVRERDLRGALEHRAHHGRAALVERRAIVAPLDGLDAVALALEQRGVRALLGPQALERR